MAHFARIENGIVTNVYVLVNSVITDSTGNEQGSLGKKFLADLYGGKPSDYVQCSYNGNIRGAYPAPSYSYNKKRDIFIAPQPGPDWILDEATCTWIDPNPPEIEDAPAS